MAYDFSSTTDKATKALDHVRQDIATLRTGKATPQLLDPVVVEAYGSQLKIHEVASVSAPDPTLLLVSPWDKSILGAVEKAIASAGLNMNPIVDGAMIRIVIPPLTEERRKEMVKLLHQKIESGRVLLRTIRTDTKKIIEKQKGEDGISEDDIERDLDSLDTTMQNFVTQLEELASKKEAELMTV